MGESLRVADVASEVGYSERHLERLFAQVFGMTVWRFVLQSRVHAAARAPAQSDRRITQIALDFGFCDASAFGRAFRASTGVTPKQYRERAAAPR